MSSIALIFASELLVKLLSLFLLNPEQEFYQAELEACCEAFELRAELQQTSTKSRKKFVEPESAMIEDSQVILSPVESLPPMDESPIEGVAPLEVIPIPELVEDYSMLLVSVS